MAEYSYFWDGTATGDALIAPYNSDVFGDVYRDLISFTNTTDGVIYTALVGYTGNLAVSNPSGSTARMATGLAMVDGKLYRNTANIDMACPTAGLFYRVVLRKDFNAQEVTAELLGPEAVVPTITQRDNDIWEIPIATVQNLAGSLVITDERIYTPRHYGEQIEDGTLIYANLADLSTASVLEDITLGGSATVDWTGINQNFRHLMIVYSARSVYAPGTFTYDLMRFRFNGDSGANYLGRICETESPGPIQTFSSAFTTYLAGAYLVNDSMTANKYSLGYILIPNYTNTNFDKGIFGMGSGHKFSVANYITTFDVAGMWNSVSAVNQVTMSTLNGGGNNFDAGSRFTLYGIP
jgi:hypothetical protein